MSSFERKAMRAQHTSEREILWADKPAKQSREFAVTNLYPRLLFTFSDVVVFVLKEARYVGVSPLSLAYRFYQPDVDFFQDY